MRVLGFTLGLLFPVAESFAPPRGALCRPTRSSLLQSSATDAPSEIGSDYAYDSLFDFSNPASGTDAVSRFDRIDDAIMGGISTSSIRFIDEQDASCASWSGVCRLDGGGFCGTRTLPFVDGKPLDVSADQEGLYLVARLASDDEPEKRVWKMTTRDANNPRSDRLYQAEFEIPKQATTNSDWQTIRVPFDSFFQVRGPVMIENGPPLNTTGGLFQIGISLSKFKIGTNTTELQDFRPGYFEMQIREIGLYGKTSSSAIRKIETVSKEEAEKQRPAALKIMLPILKFFFNEQRNRRKSATKILKSRGLSPLQIATFGFRRKAASQGILVALGDGLVRSTSAAVRFIAFWTLKLGLFYPLVTVRKIIRKTVSIITGKPIAKEVPR